MELLRRMGLESQLSGADGDGLLVKIPPTRHDILHPCDLIEDVAIAYGYNNIEKKMPPSMTIGDQVRFVLCSKSTLQSFDIN